MQTKTRQEGGFSAYHSSTLIKLFLFQLAGTQCTDKTATRLVKLSITSEETVGALWLFV